MYLTSDLIGNRTLFTNTRSVHLNLLFRVFPSLFGFEAAVWSWELVGAVMINNYILKCLVEAAFTPVTYGLVGFLKRKEDLDVYDVNTDFNPFHVRSQ